MKQVTLDRIITLQLTIYSGEAYPRLRGLEHGRKREWPVTRSNLGRFVVDTGWTDSGVSILHRAGPSWATVRLVRLCVTQAGDTRINEHQPGWLRLWGNRSRCRTGRPIGLARN
jgi:hypothetical protein